MIRVKSGNRVRYVSRRPWRARLGWLMAALIPLGVVVVVALTKEGNYGR